MKKKNRTLWGFALAALAVFTIAGTFFLHWGWKYYGLPELPDYREYESLEERADFALAYAKRHNLNEHYALFVDYGIPSGTPRLFVWDFGKNKIVASTYVMHGTGGGSTDEKACFSNRPSSKCSSLGRFLVTKEHGQRNKRGFRIKGLDFANRTAYGRGLMIHKAGWVDLHCWKKYIPLNEKCCQGCVTISSRGLDYLHPLIMNERKPLLLWNFCSTESQDK